MTVVLELHEWEQRTPDKTSALRNLSFDETPRARMLAEKLATKGMIKVTELRTGLAVSTTSCVGRITLGDLQVTIRPKIDIEVLRTLFRYGYGLRNLLTDAHAQQALQTGTFQDLLIVQLAAEVAELEARGLQRNYEAQIEALASPRGRIDLQRLAQQGGVFSAALPCRHHPRLEDTPTNRILLAGLRLATRLTSDLQLRVRLRELTARLDGQITTITLTPGNLQEARRQFTRLTAAYEPAFDLIALLLSGAGLSLEESQQRQGLPGFLFDMNRFFEALLTRFLTANLPGHQIQSQVRLRDMMRYAPHANPRSRQSPTPRPDIVVQQNGRIAALLDTKYRDLWAKPLPRDMLYQLAIYALSREHNREATILYPSAEGGRRDQIIEIREPAYDNPHARVILRAVDMNKLANVVDVRGISGERSRQELAAGLVFGESIR
jgi:5-methylcytosine-specific restriction enzyme subunit McrC